MAITPNTTFTSGAILTSVQMNRLPWGVLATSSSVTTQFLTSATHTSFQDVTDFTASTTYTENRILRVTVQVAPFIPGGANNIVYKILRGSTDISTFLIPGEAMSSGVALNLSLSATFSGPVTGATETFKLQMRGLVNTQVGNNASAFGPGRLIVEDLGEA
jgi:hypothetical protein